MEGSATLLAQWQVTPTTTTTTTTGGADDHHNYDDDHGSANHHHHGCVAARRCADTTGRPASCCANSRHPNLHRLDHRRGDPVPVSPPAAEEELIRGVGGFVPVAVAQLAEELAECGLVVRRHLHAHEHSPVVGTVVAVVEERDVPVGPHKLRKRMMPCRSGNSAIQHSSPASGDFPPTRWRRWTLASSSPVRSSVVKPALPVAGDLGGFVRCCVSMPTNTWPQLLIR